MKKSILTVVVIVVVLLFAVVAVSLLTNNVNTNTAVVQPTTTPTNTPTPVITPNTTGTSAKEDINITGMSFPNSKIINKGETVVWVNNDSTPHTVTFDDGSVDSGTIAVGATFTYTFNTVGTFTYHCNFHSFMTGQIVVQ